MTLSAPNPLPVFLAAVSACAISGATAASAADATLPQLFNPKELIDNVPAGPSGPKGHQGRQGEPGPQDPPGPQGEVSAPQLAIAISGTSNNTNPVATPGIIVSDPPAPADVQAVLNKLILALRRMP